jgi:8-oxo-dGTP pyrophosphatase MutT (NUDIX family)
MLNLSDEKIIEALKLYQFKDNPRFSRIVSGENGTRLRPAAILMPLLVDQGRWHLLLTHRSEHLVEHKGQVAFPGGGQERGDANLAFTALRETREEIGVRPQDVQIYGDLGDMPIITGYMVRVFVGRIPWPYDLTLNPDEVESAFIIPLQWLTDPDHRTIRYRSFVGREFPIIYFDLFEGHQLWGASAEMTIALLEALGLLE